MTDVIGFFAVILGTIGLIPQAIKSWKSKKTSAISKLTFILLVTAYSSWFIYGLLIKDVPLIISNFITLISAAEILYIKIKYGS